MTIEVPIPRLFERACRAALIALVAVSASLALLATGASSAMAVDSYGYLTTFGNGGGDGQSQFSSVAVGQGTGNVFLTRHGDLYVDVYAPDVNAGGSYLTSVDVYSAASLSPQNLAVDPADDSLYVADASQFGNGIAKFVSDGAPTPTYTLDVGFASPSAFVSGPAGMAVDPSTHDLLVVDRASARVFRLDSSDGSLISSFDGSDTTAGAFQSPGAVAVAPSGTIYVTDEGGARVERFSSAGVSQGVLPLPAGSQPNGVTVNPLTGEVAVLAIRGGQTYLEGFDSAAAHEFSARFPSGLTAPGGIAWDGGTDRIYASRADNIAHTFVPATQPGLDAPVVGEVGRDTAHVSANVAPDGQPTTARLEYCPASAACSSYGVSNPNDASNPWKRGPDHSLDGSSDETIEDDLPLTSNTSWRIRVSAENAATDNTSSVVNFDSPLVSPAVTTGAAGSVTDSQAELHGTIDTVGDQTTYHFEYGTDTSYGNRIPANSEAPAGNSRTVRSVSKTITGLQSGTTYHYRLVAGNSVGEAAGADRTVTTAGPDEVAPKRAYEQVTPVNKQGAQVLSNFHIHAADDGSAIALISVAASSEVQSAHILQTYMSRRGSRDWLNWQPVDPPQSGAPGLLESPTTGISSDFNHALVVSNRALAPGAIAGGGNLYDQDLRSGSYTLVAAAAGAGAYTSLVNLQANEQVFLAAAPDFSWVMFYGMPRFLPSAQGPAIYRWTRATGELTQESLLPGEIVPPFEVQFPNPYKLSLPAASTDGRVLAFGAPSGVYRRVNGQTTAVSVSRIAGDPPDAQPGVFDGMTPDGRYVFFRSGVRLTDDSPGGTMLYRYDAATDELRFLSPAGDILGVYGFSDDGQTIYTDDGAAGTVVWRAGQLRTVTTDRPVATLAGASTRVSANGRYFAWLDEAGDAHFYDADRDTAACVSCRTDGSPWGGARILTGARGISDHAVRSVTDDGTLFFDAPNRLVSSDHNGARDVYAYKNGRLTLISPGDGDFDAFFVDASVDGSSVFFQTDEGLVGRDTDGASDVYVARVGGGFASQSPPAGSAPCVRSECAEPGSGPAGGPSAPSALTGDEDAVRPAAGRVSLGKVAFTARSVRITFRASRSGRLRVTGGRVRTTSRKVGKAGRFTVTVPLSRKARGLLRDGRRFKVSLKVRLSGGWGSASAKYSRTLGK